MLTADRYHSTEANKEYMSVSQYKSFVNCEAATMAKLRGEYAPEDADALIFGKAVHHWNQHGTLDNFPDAKAWYKKDGTIYAKYEGMQDCIDALKNDIHCIAALQGQKEVIFTAEMFGCKWKIMIDSYNPEWGIFADLKVMRDITSKYWTDGRYVSFVEHYGYDTQMSVYAEVERLATGRLDRLEPHIVVVTKEKPPSKVILKGFAETIDSDLLTVEQNMPRILAVKNGEVEPEHCGKCAYCREKMLAPIIDYRDLII